MSYFIKTETIKKPYLSKINIKNKIIKDHVSWVKELLNEGYNIKSGFLVDKDNIPGAGGVLIIECESFQEAEKIIKNDPMIKNKIVHWNLNEWINVIG
tara:strand:- start:339 stop:632 length:294 start_codon:yes stop_codon:yes gene_type:complete